MRSEIDIHKYVMKYQFPVDIANHEWLDIKLRNKRLFTQIFTPPRFKETVLFLHGFFDHSGTHTAFIRFLLKEGFRVIVFDLPGHGLSDGKRFQVESFEEYQLSFQSVTEVLRKKGIYLSQAVGHSTGAAIIAERLLEGKKNTMDFQKACLIAPLLRSNQWWISKMFTTLLSPFLKKIPRKFPDVSASGEFIKHLKKDPLQGRTVYLEWVKAMFEWEKLLTDNKPASNPVLFIQGMNDQTVDWQHNMKVYQRLFPHSTRIIVDEGTHYLLHNESIVTYKLIVDYLKK